MQNKRRRNKSSQFIPNLHKILSDKQSGAYWNEDGKSFVLNDFSKLISNSLIKYFRHSNITSFIRQLNLYGFKKLVSEEYEENTYYHKNFSQLSFSQLKPIKSFYNKSRYGHVKKHKILNESRPSALSFNFDKQKENSNKMEAIQDPEFLSSLKDLKLKISYLEMENQRLKAIEEEYLRLVNSMNPCEKVCNLNDQPSDPQNYVISAEKQTSIVCNQGTDSYIYSITQPPTYNNHFFYFQTNPYYMPFQGML